MSKETYEALVRWMSYTGKEKFMAFRLQETARAYADYLNAISKDFRAEVVEL